MLNQEQNQAAREAAYQLWEKRGPVLEGRARSITGCGLPNRSAHAKITPCPTRRKSLRAARTWICPLC